MRSTSELLGGAKWALRRWPKVLIIAAQMCIASFVLVLVLSDVLVQLAVLRGGAELRTRHSVTFTPYYLTQDVSTVHTDTVRSLARLIDQGDAYTAVIYNTRVDQPGFADGYPTILLIGDAVVDLYPDLSLCSPAPCAMRGAGVSLPPNYRFDIASVQIQGLSVLSRNATLFDPNSAGLVLDGHVVLRLPPEALTELDAIEREEALTKAVMFAPSAGAVRDYVSGGVDGGLYLVPHDVAVDQPERFRDLMTGSAIYVLGMTAFLILVFSAFSSSASAAVRREARAFAIRRAYGATPWLVALRVGGYLATTMLALPLPIVLLLSLVGEPVKSGAVAVAWGIAIVFAVLWFNATRLALSRAPLEGGNG